MKILITGNAGFIGTESWKYFLNKGYELYGVDNLARKSSKVPEGGASIVDNITNIDNLNIPKVDWVIHLAAQVSVVDSINIPEEDFNTNAYGSFKVVQWAKRNNAKVIYASTNKVFGDLEDVNYPLRDNAKFAPKTNYGVSKCTGAMYTLDNGGTVLNQSCIYGETQMGDENQGWVGWIRQCIKNKRPIICYGDGTQVRDLLHVNDLVNCYDMIINGKIPQGNYVIGGGVRNMYTFKEVVELFGGSISEYQDWRLSDQRFFVSSNELLERYGWTPKIMFKDITNRLI